MTAPATRPKRGRGRPRKAPPPSNVIDFLARLTAMVARAETRSPREELALATTAARKLASTPGVTLHQLEMARGRLIAAQRQAVALLWTADGTACNPVGVMGWLHRMADVVTAATHSLELAEEHLRRREAAKRTATIIDLHTVRVAMQLAARRGARVARVAAGKAAT